MPDRTHIPGKFVWYELWCSDPPRAQAFYAELFAWKTVPWPVGGATYSMIFAGETPDTMIGGYVPLSPGDAWGGRWIASVSVDDVDAAVSAAVASGGAVLVPPHDSPAAGRRARIADPAGAELALIKSARGDAPDVEDTPPGRFFWNELHTTDPNAALSFHEKTAGFAWEAMPGPSGAYYVLSRGGVGRGGVTAQLSPGARPHWLPYVRVADVDTAVARAARLGGEIATPATDIPGIGRMAVLRDVAGADLAVMKPNPRSKAG